MNNSDSSSEDEASMQVLREVVDQTFFNETLFKKTSEPAEEGKCINPIIQKVSLREKKDEFQQFEHFGLTQSFKQFVSKKLSEVLDMVIQEESGIADKHLQPNNRNCQNKGIQLLSSLNTMSDIEENVDEMPIKQKHKKIKRIKSDDVISNDEKIKAVAVTPDWVLSKQDTKLWTNRRKSKVFKYKKVKNGILKAVDE